jgi:integrase
MASIWKHPESQYWTACFRDQTGKQRRVTTKATDRQKAKAIADSLEKAVRTKRTLQQAQVALDRLHEEISGHKVSRKSLRDFANDWLETKAPETAPRTQVFYVASISKLISFLGKRALEPLSEVTKDDIVAYRNHLAKQLSPSTANHDLKVTRMLFRAARRDHLIADDPAEFVSTIRQRDSDVKRPFTLAEIAAVVDVADAEWRSLIFFAFYTGQRLSDLATLTWNNVDLDRGEVRMVTGKTGRRMIIPLASALRVHIESMPASHDSKAPLHPRASQVLARRGNSSMLSRQFAELLARAGLREKTTHVGRGKTRSVRREVNALSFHSLRRTATTLLHEAGVAAAVAQALIGHDSEQIHNDYINVGRDALKNAVATLPTIL